MAARFLAFFTLLLAGSTAGAQTAQQSPDPASQTPYTIRTESHVVLTDVTVTDSKGNPVRGLPQSAFHISDNKQPQSIASFEEHVSAPAQPGAIVPASAPGIYSNDFLLHLPPVLNVIVIDLINIDITDQMYLNYELTKFFKKQPEQPVAIYLRASNRTFLLQNFTSDPELLTAAVHKAIPRFPPTGRQYLTDFDTMHEVAVSLEQYPGRKNVIWFTGGTAFFLRPDGAIAQNDANWREVYDELDKDRIAIYPVDPRGLTYYSPRSPASQIIPAQHIQMNDIATATGGKAFYNTNGLSESTARVLDAGGSFYTLTYSPTDLKFDNKWHKVQVKIDGGDYRLSYRSGYFADGNMRSGDTPAKARTRITASGERFDDAPEMRSSPIIFQARVVPSSDPSVAAMAKPNIVLRPSPDKKDSIPFLIRYTVPLSALTLETAGNKQQTTMGVAMFAYNRQGSTVDRHADKIMLTVNPESLREHPDTPVTIDQQLNLTKGDEYIYLAVWDMNSGRMGTLEIPLDVPKPGKQKTEATIR